MSVFGGNRMSRVLPVVAGLLGAALLCSSCGSDDGGKIPEFDGAKKSSSSSPSPSPTPTDAAKVDLKSLPDGKVVVVRNKAQTAEEKAVATAWAGYWTARMGAFTKVDTNYPGLSEHSVGKALSTVISYVNTLKGSGLHEIGAGLLAVNGVTVSGNTAVVDGCLYNNGRNADKDGTPVERPTVYLKLKDKLVKQGDAWMVSSLKVTTKRCRYR